MPDTTAILFIHNLDSGVLQSLHDYSSSKGAASKADACPLSRITHSPLGIKKEWKRCLKELPIPPRLLDRDQFISEFGHRPLTFPVVLLKRGAELSVLVSTDELNRCMDLSDLVSLVGERVRQQ